MDGEILDKEDLSGPDTPAFNTMVSKLNELMPQFQKGAADVKNDPPADPAPKPVAIAPIEQKPAPKPPEAKPDPKPLVPDLVEPVKKDAPADEPLPASIKTPKAAEEFKALRSERDEWKTKTTKAEELMKQADAELAKMREASKTIQIPDSVKTELETTKKELEEYRTRLRQLDLERDPQFDAYFSGTMKKEMATVESLNPEKGAELKKLIALPDSEYRTQRLIEIAGEMDDVKKGRLFSAIDRIERLNSEKADALSQHGEHLKQMQAQRAAQTESQQKEAARKVGEAKTAELAKAREHLSSFKPIEGDEAHNASVKEREAIVDAFYDGKLPPDQLGKLPIWAAHGMYLQKTALPAAMEQIRRLTEQLKSYQAATPAVAGTGSKPSGGQKDPKTMTFLERFQYERNS